MPKSFLGLGALGFRVLGLGFRVSGPFALSMQQLSRLSRPYL